MLLDAVPPAEDAADGVLARPGGVVGVVAVGGGGGGGRGGVAAAAVLARVPVVMHLHTYKLNPAKKEERPLIFYLFSLKATWRSGLEWEEARRTRRERRSGGWRAEGTMAVKKRLRRRRRRRWTGRRLRRSRGWRASLRRSEGEVDQLLVRHLHV